MLCAISDEKVRKEGPMRAAQTDAVKLKGEAADGCAHTHTLSERTKKKNETREPRGEREEMRG